MEVVCIKKILAQNLLIHIGLHCVRIAITLATQANTGCAALTHYMAVKQTSFLPSKWNLYPKNIIFGLQMTVKSGLGNLILKFLPARTCFLLLYKIPKITTRTNEFFERL